MSLRSAVIARWNNAGLNTSIGLLFPYSGKSIDEILSVERRQPEGGAVAAPNVEPLPRCRVVTMDEVPQGDTAEEKTFSRCFFLYVISDRLTTLEAYKPLIEQAFENSHKFSSNPFAMSGYSVTEIDTLGSDEHVREKACFLEIGYKVLYHRARRLPV